MWRLHYLGSTGLTGRMPALLTESSSLVTIASHGKIMQKFFRLAQLAQSFWLLFLLLARAAHLFQL
eukprot:10868640-Karenia_brevis.AAC.1